MAVSRRGMLATPLLVLPAAGQAQAPQSPLVEIGIRGWIFPLWDRMVRVNLAAQRIALQIVTQAIGLMRAARIQVALCLVPSKKRVMRQFLPASVVVSPEVAQRYSLTLSAAQRAGALVPDLEALSRAQMQRDPGRNLQTLPPEGPAALLEDHKFDTVVVGTSKIQPRFGFQPMLSNQVIRPVGLFWRPNNVGSYFALLEYLRSGAFQRQRPSALVWNLLERDMPSATNSTPWGTAAMSPAEFLPQMRRALARVLVFSWPSVPFFLGGPQPARPGQWASSMMPCRRAALPLCAS